MNIFDFFSKNIIRKKHLNNFYLKNFKRESSEIYQVWKIESKFFVAINVVSYGDDLYAKETMDFGENLTAAKKYCDELRRNYILTETKKRKIQKPVY